MLVGHAMIGFSIALSIRDRVNVDRNHILIFALLTSVFSMIPDVDLVYGITGLIELETSTLSQIHHAFWQRGHRFHRGPTHSIITGLITSFSILLILRNRHHTLLFGSLTLSLFTIFTVYNVNAISGIIIALYFVTAVLVSLTAVNYGIRKKAITKAAIIGLTIHPITDIYTSETPNILYPIPVQPFPEYITVSSDPTITLLFVLIIEAVTMWIAVTVYMRFREKTVKPHLKIYSAVGVLSVLIVPIIDPPTLASFLNFTLILLGIAVLSIIPEIVKYIVNTSPKREHFSNKVPKIDRRYRSRSDYQIQMFVSILLTATVGLFSYTVGYTV